MEQNTEFMTWKNLDLYTKEIKEWVEKLFRKAHARMGHIEEDLIKVRKETKTDYQLEAMQVGTDKLNVNLYETVSGTHHGGFTISTTGQIELTKWEEAGGEGGTKPFPRP